MEKNIQKLYDRSIRTWGMEAQQLLLNSHILAVGYDPLMSEILKNVVISGISKVTVIDTYKGEPIHTTQCDKNHLFTLEQGSVRTSSIEKVKSVNSDLTIDVIQENQLNDDLFNSLSVIICTLPDERLLSKLESSHKPIIFCSSIGGIGSFYVTNINGHYKPIKEYVFSDIPKMIARQVIKTYFIQYNTMDTYSIDTLSSSFVHHLNKEEQLELLVGFNYAPVNSVIGSLAAQEVINIIGKRPTYTNEDSNGFIYDSVNNIGDIICTDTQLQQKNIKIDENKHFVVLD
ncbi:hypothetical protein EDI_234910 [Entamoeba dispar SAW760]|uniref:THIF-type NAD/FAD binding fold domain-containing protein n=1 Tax=Entamoeba dispar (strain ATCC PRA-260 / SAW760) TaxID=370354 RepID=B0EL85_ENTDS|nr:uncharacterized protein EDI_234910 [Entamoeba dispar SAW760]EDR24699.1 hypothetical protein EDI_234910 [Entamoeba dispar SAW760]|eukprot:EDR24699.1 hypothetical protein EDI_234910 [Entamoeba dispar SAW760]